MTRELTAAEPAASTRRMSTRKLLTGLIALFLVLLLLSVVNLVITLGRTAAACDFYRDLGGQPVTVTTTTGRPSPLSMEIIAHSRQAYRGSGCSGHLPPASPSFRHWAPAFHVDPE